MTERKRRYEQALEDEMVRIEGLRNLETRAREVRRGVTLAQHAVAQFTRKRDELVHELHTDYGWTYEAIGTYFGRTRQWAHECDTRRRNGNRNGNRADADRAPSVGA